MAPCRDPPPPPQCAYSLSVVEGEKLRVFRNPVADRSADTKARGVSYCQINHVFRLKISLGSFFFLICGSTFLQFCFSRLTKGRNTRMSLSVYILCNSPPPFLPPFRKTRSHGEERWRDWELRRALFSAGLALDLFSSV